MAATFPLPGDDAARRLEAELRGAADIICDHVFDLLGSGPTRLGERIDWHSDFKTRYRWNPKTYFVDIAAGRLTGADIKVPWELSRGHHLLVLAQAWRVTGDRKYAREATRQIDDWITNNPPSFGVNWTSTMEVGIRTVNWLWASALLANADDMTDELFERILAALLAHGRHIESNLEIHSDGTTTNHYLANVVGLLYLGLCLPTLTESESWRRFALSSIAAEMHKQVLSDGGDYESSIPYHRLAAEMFLSATWLSGRCGVTWPSAFLRRLSRMIEFAVAYTKPNGLAPQIGDADDGRLHVLTGYGNVDARDHRHLIAVGALLFKRDEWLALSGDRWIETLWLGGPAVPPARATTPQVSAAFRDSGIYILRAKDDMVVFAAGPVGTGGLGNHKHNDLLAIDVHLAGEDVIVDAGTYVYTPDPEARDAFRSTRAHNTVMVDRAEQNRLPTHSLFSLCNDATPVLLSWEPAEDGGAVTAEHDGYTRLDRPVIHRRTVRLAYPHRVFVDDAFDGQAGASHQFCWTFTFAPGTEVTPEERGWMVVTSRRRQFLLSAPLTTGGQPLGASSECVTGFVSPRYGVREAAAVLRWTWESTVPVAVSFRAEVVH